MPMRYRVDPNDSIVYVTNDGTSFDEWRIVMDRLLVDSEYRPGMDFVVDRRQAPPPEMSYVQATAGYVTAHSDRFRDSRSALVVTGSAAYGMGRVAEVLYESTPHALQVFTDYETAESWVRG